MPPARRSRSQARPAPMWSLSEAGACCASTPTCCTPEWQQLLKTKSMTRYLPPNGSALTARSAHSTPSRSPLPPERIRARMSRTTRLRSTVSPWGSIPETRTVGTARRGSKLTPPRGRGRAAGRGDAAVARLPADRGAQQVRRLQVVVVGEVGIVGGEEAVERGRVVGAKVLVAHADAEIEVLPVDAGAQRERVAVPVLEAGAQVGVQGAHLD